MSQTAFLFCEKSKEILFLGKVIYGDPDHATKFWYNGAEDGAVEHAIFQFLLDHVGNTCLFLTDKVLWSMDLDGFVWVDSDYGLPHFGPRELDSEGKPNLDR